MRMLDDRIRTVFLSACDYDRDERDRFLDSACFNDNALKLEVEALLRFDKVESSFLDTPILRSESHRLLVEPTAEEQNDTIPERIASYRIVRRVGCGGSGVVFEAIQDNPERSVALKILRPEFVTGSLLDRFKREAQVLGLLEHKGIARIYEAGTADWGFGRQPFFAMEFIRGHAITEHIARHGLSLRQRLQLLGEICDAVQYAHTQGIVHRDLKPGNIVVDEAGRATVVDFGVARILGDAPALTAGQTKTGQVIGTLQYMAPEQIAESASGVTESADIYALGVIAYEMLTGSLPYDLSRATLADVVERIKQYEPPRLGTHDRRLHGDLETIIATAMAKEPAERYESAAALAEDIRLYLQSKPIKARPPSAVGRAVKFTRRNRAAVGLAGVGVLAGVLAIGGMISAVVQQQRTKVISGQTEELTRALQTLLDQATTVPLSGLTTHDGGLADAAAVLLQLFDEQPLQYSEVARQYALLVARHGEPAEAEAYLVAALERLEEHGTLDSEEGLRVVARLYTLHLGLAQRREFNAFADAYGDRALTFAEESLGPNHFATLCLQHARSQHDVLEGRLDIAERQLRDLDERCRRLLGKTAHLSFVVRRDLAMLLSETGRHDEAIRLMQDVELRWRTAAKEEGPWTIKISMNLAGAYWNAGRYEQAERLFREAVDRLGSLPGDHGALAAAARQSVGVCLRDQGRLDESEPLLIEALEWRRGQNGTDHPDFANSLITLSILKYFKGEIDEAEILARRGRSIRETLDTKIDQRAEADLILGFILLEQGEIERAEQLLHQAKELYATARAKSHWLNALTQSGLGGCQLARGHRSEARLIFEENLPIIRAARGTSHPWVQRVEQWTGQCDDHD